MATKPKKSKLNILSNNNELIKQLEGSEYIKNPLIYSQIRGDFSLIQTNVLVAIAATLQDRINSKFKNGKMGPLFSPEELSHGKISFEVPLNSLGVRTKEYAAVHDSCKDLLKLDTSYTYAEYDEEGHKIGDRVKTSVIFTDVDVPTKPTTTGKVRREGTLRISMNADVAGQIFNQNSGYVEHLGGIVRLCRSPRTPRLYIYLSAWRGKGTCTFNYLALKEFLGVLTYNKDRSAIIRDSCTTWAVFHRDVLDPAQREMERLSKENKVEFYFNYEPVYHNGRKRGNPDCVRFNIFQSENFVRPQRVVEKPAPQVKELTQEQKKQWDDLCEAIRQTCDEDFSTAFVPYCSLKESDENWVFINVPNRYVAEQWEARLDRFKDDFFRIFGDKAKLNYNILPPPPR